MPQGRCACPAVAEARPVIGRVVSWIASGHLSAFARSKLDVGGAKALALRSELSDEGGVWRAKIGASACAPQHTVLPPERSDRTSVST